MKNLYFMIFCCVFFNVFLPLQGMDSCSSIVEKVRRFNFQRFINPQKDMLAELGDLSGLSNATEDVLFDVFSCLVKLFEKNALKRVVASLPSIDTQEGWDVVWDRVMERLLKCVLRGAQKCLPARLDVEKLFLLCRYWGVFERFQVISKSALEDVMAMTYFLVEPDSKKDALRLRKEVGDFLSELDV